MGNEEEETESGVGRVAELLSLRLPPLIRSRQHSGALTPPLHTQVSVPFRWEEEPGKPLPLPLPSPCTAPLALLHSSNNAAFVKSLELPPRLLINDSTNKTPSPTTVLDGPDTYTYTNTNTTTSTSLGIGMGMGRSLLESSSLRFLSLRKRGQASFDGDTRTRTRTRTPGSSPDRGLLGAIILSNSGTGNKMKMKMKTKTKTKKKKEKGTWGSWRKTKGNKTEEGDDGNENCVFSTFSDDETSPTCHSAHTVKVSTTTSLPINTNRSLSTLSCANSHFWVTIYGALKQVIPRRSAKLKNDAL